MVVIKMRLIIEGVFCKREPVQNIIFIGCRLPVGIRLGENVPPFIMGVYSLDRRACSGNVDPGQVAVEVIVHSCHIAIGVSALCQIAIRIIGIMSRANGSLSFQQVTVIIIDEIGNMTEGTGDFGDLIEPGVIFIDRGQLKATVGCIPRDRQYVSPGIIGVSRLDSAGILLACNVDIRIPGEIKGVPLRIELIGDVSVVIIGEAEKLFGRIGFSSQLAHGVIFNLICPAFIGETHHLVHVIIGHGSDRVSLGVDDGSQVVLIIVLVLDDVSGRIHHGGQIVIFIVAINPGSYMSEEIRDGLYAAIGPVRECEGSAICICNRSNATVNVISNRDGVPIHIFKGGKRTISIEMIGR